MSNVFTLEALREETVRRYAPTKVDLGADGSIELKSILRISTEDRKKVLAIIEDLNDIDTDDESEESVEEWSELVVDSCANIFKLITKSSKKLLANLDHDDPTIKANLHTAVLHRWVSGTQLGEAGSSPS